jgi:hypothetical protein
MRGHLSNEIVVTFLNLAIKSMEIRPVMCLLPFAFNSFCAQNQCENLRAPNFAVGMAGPSRASSWPEALCLRSCLGLRFGAPLR